MDMRNACLRPPTAFLMVPIQLIRDPSLSPLAKTVLIYMASHAPGYVVRRSQIMAATGISIRTWNRAARELKARGALRTVLASANGQSGLRGYCLHADWSEWHQPRTETHHETPPPSVDNSTMARFHDGRERDPDSDPKGIPTRIPKGSPKKRERKKERACARDREIEAAGRGRSIQAPASAGATETPRQVPSLERRRELATELGLALPRDDLWRLSGGAVAPAAENREG